MLDDAGQHRLGPIEGADRISGAAARGPPPTAPTFVDMHDGRVGPSPRVLLAYQYCIAPTVKAELELVDVEYGPCGEVGAVQPSMGRAGHALDDTEENRYADKLDQGCSQVYRLGTFVCSQSRPQPAEGRLMNQVVKVGLGSLVVALMFTMSLAKVAEAKCVAQTLQVHSGWGQTGTHIGSVTLFGDTVVADDGDNVCVSFQKDGKKKYGQWACRRGTVEFVQFLSLKSSFNDPSSCKHRHKGSFSAK